MIKVTMTLAKETSGALRYEEATKVADGANIGMLYIRKSAFKGKTAPKVITVLVDEANLAPAAK